MILASTLLHSLWWLRSIQCVKKRNSSFQRWVFFGFGYGKNAYLVVIRQSKRSRTCRDLNGISEEIGTLVRLVESVRCVMVRNIPCEIGWFNVTCLESDIVFRVTR